ncbi:hypothetical protein [Curvibacter gracilis]|uniref:hypothetical protein n=1 Tax=Curvibacter gracilis TaxID=230310 RepID=UPI0012FAE59F|nr:hypothetical protein [Curvibacter gracilis]
MATVERNVLAKVGVSELKIEGRINTPIEDLNLTKWTLGTLIALNVAILRKVFVH